MILEFKMASRFPASAQMKIMAAGMPQQGGMYQRQQFQQPSYGVQRPTGTGSPMPMRMPAPSGSHHYSPNVPRASLAPGAAAAMEQARRRQDLKSRRRKKKIADKVLPQRVRDLVPESQAYMDLLAFERKLDATIMRKRMDIQEALKRPIKTKKKLRVYLTTNFHTPKPDAEDLVMILSQDLVRSYKKYKELACFLARSSYDHGKIMDEEALLPSWELRVEGRLIEDPNNKTEVQRKRKFSTFFKSLVIELDRELYGPDNHLVEWHRTSTTQETDGFQVKRPGEENVKCTIMFLLDYQPPQYKLDPRLARLLGIHTQTRPVIVNAIWQYIKSHNLQDAHEREYINNDRYFKQIFECERMKFSEIPQRLSQLLMPPDPIVINHLINKDVPENKRVTCYDIDVEVDDTLKAQMQSFLLSTASQNEIATYDNKIYETVETINNLKINREFFLGFARDPQEFINKWVQSQSQDLKVMTDVVGNPEQERRADFYYLPWSQEAVCRYFYSKVQQKRAELEQALGIRGT